jgi:hypothetical protein
VRGTQVKEQEGKGQEGKRAKGKRARGMGQNGKIATELDRLDIERQARGWSNERLYSGIHARLGKKT